MSIMAIISAFYLVVLMAGKNKNEMKLKKKESDQAAGAIRHFFVMSEGLIIHFLFFFPLFFLNFFFKIDLMFRFWVVVSAENRRHRWKYHVG